MRNAQQGISLMGLIFTLVLVVVVALFAMKVIPSFLEFRTAKSAIEAVARQAETPADARRAFDNRATIDDINSVRAQDLEISREGNQLVIAFAYRKEVSLVGPVGLYIDYAANSKGQYVELLGYSFKDPRLLEQALTHRSHGAGHNERLEFLGDGVLGCAVADELYARFPQLPEGKLTQMRAALVREESLVRIAKALGLGARLRAAALQDSMLADGLEAVLGAIFLDGGYPAARSAVVQAFGPLLEALDPGKVEKDAKTRLQELMHARGKPIPAYSVVATHGAPHERSFEVECTVDGRSAMGSGTSRQRAEQEAAKAMLLKIEQ